jgi:hypothetical protein
MVVFLGGWEFFLLGPSQFWIVKELMWVNCYDILCGASQDVIFMSCVSRMPYQKITIAQ